MSKIANGNFVEKMTIFVNFFEKNVKFLAIFWQSNGNFPEGQNLTSLLLYFRLDQNYVVRIADFGLTRSIGPKDYYISANKQALPVKWMAIESIDTGHYSTESDVVCDASL